MHQDRHHQDSQDFSATVAGFVLAGGRSSRMGHDKARLLFRGRPLIETAVSALRGVTNDVHIVGDRPDLEEFAPTVPDQFRECGPLGGIEAALRVTDREWNVVLGVDTPLVPARLLQYLVTRAMAERAQVTVPRVGGMYEPLCAVYNKSMVLWARQALEQKTYRVEWIFQPETLCVITEEELAAIGIGAEVFVNLNTPEEFEAIRRRDA